MKNIDVKSLLIGFLLCSIFFFGVAGAGGPQTGRYQLEPIWSVAKNGVTHVLRWHRVDTTKEPCPSNLAREFGRLGTGGIGRYQVKYGLDQRDHRPVFGRTMKIMMVTDTVTGKTKVYTQQQYTERNKPESFGKWALLPNPTLAPERLIRESIITSGSGP